MKIEQYYVYFIHIHMHIGCNLYRVYIYSVPTLHSVTLQHNNAETIFVVEYHRKSVEF